MVTLPAPQPAAYDRFAPPLLEVVNDTLHLLTEHEAAPGRVVPLAPGVAPAWDDCCDGQLYSRIMAVTPIYSTTRTAQGARCTPVRLDVQAAIGLLRCAAVVDDRGAAPSAREIFTDGLEMSADLALMLTALQCSSKVSQVTKWVPLGVEGGCHGGEWQFEFIVNV